MKPMIVISEKMFPKIRVKRSIAAEDQLEVEELDRPECALGIRPRTLMNPSTGRATR